MVKSELHFPDVQHLLHQQSSFVRHFFGIINWPSKLKTCGLLSSFKCFIPNGRVFVFSEALKEVPAWMRTYNTTCITQITLEFTDNGVLVDEGSFGLHHFDFVTNCRSCC